MIFKYVEQGTFYQASAMRATTATSSTVVRGAYSKFTDIGCVCTSTSGDGVGESLVDRTSTYRRLLVPSP